MNLRILAQSSVAFALVASVTTSTAVAADDEATKLKAKGAAVVYTMKTTDPASSIDTGGAAIYVNAPIATVRKIVQDYGHYSQLNLPFQQSRVLSKKKGSSEVYLSVPVIHGSVTIWAVVQIPPPVKDGDGEKIVAKYERGNLGDFRATWRLRAVDADHTVLKLELLVDPKMPVPTAAITNELKSASDKAVTAVRDKAQATPQPAQPIAEAQKKPADGGR